MRYQQNTHSTGFDIEFFDIESFVRWHDEWLGFYNLASDVDSGRYDQSDSSIYDPLRLLGQREDA